MNTKTWGPSAWKFTHIIMTNAPDEMPIEKQKVYKDFFISFGKILPCKYCRDSYEQFMKYFPIDNYIHSGYLLRWWWYNIHNFVNVKLNVPKENIPTFMEVINKYDQYKSQK